MKKNITKCIAIFILIIFVSIINIKIGFCFVPYLDEFPRTELRRYADCIGCEYSRYIDNQKEDNEFTAVSKWFSSYRDITVKNNVESLLILSSDDINVYIMKILEDKMREARRNFCKNVILDLYNKVKMQRKKAKEFCRLKIELHGHNDIKRKLIELSVKIDKKTKSAEEIFAEMEDIYKRAGF